MHSYGSLPTIGTWLQRIIIIDMLFLKEREATEILPLLSLYLERLREKY